MLKIQHVRIGDDSCTLELPMYRYPIPLIEKWSNTMTTSKIRRAPKSVWTQAQITRLEKLYPASTWQALLKAFPGKSDDAIRSKAVRLGIKRDINQTVIVPKLTAQTAFRNQVIDFLKRARTDDEIVQKFGKNGLKEADLIAVQPPDGQRILFGQNGFQQRTRCLERVPGKFVKPQARIFSLRVSNGDPAYIAIIFPQEQDFSDDEIRIVPFDSVHFGSKTSDLKRFKSHLRYLEEDHAFGYLNGNIFGAQGYTKHTAEERRAELRELLAPVAHKILFAQSGTSEERLTRVDGVEPLQAICQDLGIYHTDRPLSVDFYWKKKKSPIELYTIHGRSNAIEAGAKANLGEKIARNQNFPHFVVHGRLKEGRTGCITARRLDPIRLQVVEHPTFVLFCPGFEQFEGSNEEKKGKEYPAMGGVALIIKSDNTHHASN